MHWIFLSVLAATILTAMLVNVQTGELQRWNMYADWAAATMGGAGVVVAGLAAYYLRRTLTETQHGTRLMREQLWSNRAYMACTEIKADPKGTYSGHDYKSIVIRLKSKWQNFGNSPAINVLYMVKLGNAESKTTTEIAGTDLLNESRQSIVGQGEQDSREHEIEAPILQIGIDPDHPKYSPIYITLLAHYEDVHRRRFLVENQHAISIEVSIFDGQIHGLKLDPVNPTNLESQI